MIICVQDLYMYTQDIANWKQSNYRSMFIRLKITPMDLFSCRQWIASSQSDNAHSHSKSILCEKFMVNIIDRIVFKQQKVLPCTSITQIERKNSALLAWPSSSFKENRHLVLTEGNILNNLIILVAVITSFDPLVPVEMRWLSQLWLYLLADIVRSSY